MGVDRKDFSGAANWQIPRELPDLRRVGIVALDTETQRRGVAGTIAVRPGHGATAMSAASASPRARTARTARSTFRCATPTATTSTPLGSIAGSRI